MVLFIFEFILTNIIFSLIICGMFLYFDRENNYTGLEILLYSLGTGPVFTTLILYYLILLFPKHSNFFYFFIVISLYIILFFIGLSKGSLKKIEIELHKKEKFRIKNEISGFKKINNILYKFIIFILLFCFLFIFFNTLKTPVIRHDALIYGTMGKLIFIEKTYDFKGYMPHYKTGFYSKILHAPSFSLLLTWEKLVDSFFKKNKDIYFRSITAYYGLLIILIQFFWLYKKNRYLALLGIILLISGYSFYVTLISYHLDFYRIFFLIVSLIFLAYTIKNKDLFSLFLFGIFSGFSSFSHSIGMIIACIGCLALFIFLRESLKDKLIKSSMAFLLILVFGGIHYIIDIFFGNGWILK